MERYLESKGFTFSRAKTKSLKCKFSKGEEEMVEGIAISGTSTSKFEEFKNLGSIVQGN